MIEIMEEEGPPPKAEPISATKEGGGVIFGGGIALSLYHYGIIFLFVRWLCCNTPRLGFNSLSQPPYPSNIPITQSQSHHISQQSLQHHINLS